MNISFLTELDIDALIDVMDVFDRDTSTTIEMSSLHCKEGYLLEISINSSRRMTRPILDEFKVSKRKTEYHYSGIFDVSVMSFRQACALLKPQFLHHSIRDLIIIGLMDDQPGVLIFDTCVFYQLKNGGWYVATHNRVENIALYAKSIRSRLSAMTTELALWFNGCEIQENFSNVTFLDDEREISFTCQKDSMGQDRWILTASGDQYHFTNGLLAQYQLHEAINKHMQPTALLNLVS